MGDRPVVGVYDKLTTIARSQSDLIRFAANALAIATALGFIGAAFAAMQLAPNALHYGFVILFAAVVFAVEWCGEAGPPRWRPMLISERRFKHMTATAVGLLIAVVVVAVVIACRTGRL